VATPITLESIPNDGFVTNESQPIFEGTAPPGSQVTITVHSPQIFTATIDVSGDGSWNWTPPADLEPGPHSVNLSYIDSEGKLHQVTRTFVIASATADNSLLNYSATPSATIVPTPTATASATPTPPLRTAIPATDSGMPVASTTTPTYFIIVFGTITLFGGLLLRRQLN
jgi:hypothetical protein